MTAPKLFVSYSWSSPTHEQWVLDLATELRELEIDVILDKWDLKEGHDAISFMEQMVTNPEVKKVVIISDRTYATKADGRAGGVGTETQIISKEVYDKQSQEKFVAVVAEKDDSGRPFLPTYYKSRIYIDLSEPDKYAENFERLVRWVFDKPLYQKPALGKRPAFLDDGDSVSLGTGAAFKRCIDAIRNSKPTASGALSEYFEVFAQNLERFRIQKDPAREFDDTVIQSIEAFLPFRNELVQLFVVIAQYSPTEDFVGRLHRFFESLIPYLHKPEHVQQWNEWDFDNFKFVVHELFLYALAVLLKYDRLELASEFLARQYYVPGNSEYGRNATVSFVAFRNYLKSLVHRNSRLGLRKLSLHSMLLKERCTGLNVEFRHLMQADFVAFLRSEVEADNEWDRWWPETLLYLGHFNQAFEIFARATSQAYFERVKGLIAIQAPSDLTPLFEAYKTRKRELPKWEFQSFSPSALVGFEQLATRA